MLEYSTTVHDMRADEELIKEGRCGDGVDRVVLTQHIQQGSVCFYWPGSFMLACLLGMR